MALMSEDNAQSRRFQLTLTVFGVFLYISMDALFKMKGGILEKLSSAEVYSPLAVGLVLSVCVYRLSTDKLERFRRILSIPWVLLGVITLLWCYFAIHSLLALRRNDELSRIITENINPFRLALEQYVLPRRLTADQRKAIKDYLEKNEKGTVIFVIHKNDNEAGAFAGDIQRALIDSGWIIGKVERAESMDEGIRIEYRHPPPQNGDNPHRLGPDKILEQALRLVGIQGGGGGGWGKNDTTESLTIMIGARRRDSAVDFQKWE